MRHLFKSSDFTPVPLYGRTGVKSDDLKFAKSTAHPWNKCWIVARTLNATNQWFEMIWHQHSGHGLSLQEVCLGQTHGRKHISQWIKLSSTFIGSVVFPVFVWDLLSFFVWGGFSRIPQDWLQGIQITCAQAGETDSWLRSGGSLGPSPPSQSRCDDTLFGEGLKEVGERCTGDLHSHSESVPDPLRTSFPLYCQTETLVW